MLESSATAGIEHARARLLDLRATASLRATTDPSRAFDAWAESDGMVIGPVPLGQTLYRVELHDAGARLNLNVATEEQLRRFLGGLRLDARRADHLAQAIADWRDEDDLRRINGAERQDYLRAAAPLLPENGPIESVGTLRFVIGMSDSLFSAMRAYVTTVGSGRINLNTASRAVLLALPGMTEESASLIVSYRRRGRRVLDLDRFADELSPPSRERFRDALPALRASTVLETREIHAVSEAWQPGSAFSVRVDAVLTRDDEAHVIWRKVAP